MAIFQFQRFLACVFSAIAMSKLPVAATQATGTDSITCEMEMVDYMFSHEASYHSRLAIDEDWSCVDENDQDYDLGGEWRHKLREFSVHAGVTVVHFQGITLQPGEINPRGIPKIVVHADSIVQVVENEISSGRRLGGPMSGEIETLVVRVTDRDGNQPDMTAAEISERIFGTTSGGVESVQSHLALCSGGQFQLYPSTRGHERSNITSSNIENGVLDLTITAAVTNYTHATKKVLKNQVRDLLKEIYDDHRIFGRLLFILPEEAEIGDDAVAYGYMNSRVSVYKGVPSFHSVIHELGHNLGLRHSGVEDGSEYGDDTCRMGRASAPDHYDYPQKCFNGVKSYLLGWYDTPEKKGHQDIDIPQGSSWRGKLVGVHDYFSPQYDGNECSDYRVIAKIYDLYIIFNRAEAFTIDAPHPNTVTVTEYLYKPISVGNDGEPFSNRKPNGILAEGGVGHFTTNVTEVAVTVMVCDISQNDTDPAIIDYADVIIFPNDPEGSVVKSCDTEPYTNNCESD